jgi:hypothetical protein
MGAEVVPIFGAELCCSRCGFPITGRFLRSPAEGMVHADVAHCDQLTEADEVATYLEGISDRVLTDEMRLSSSFSTQRNRRVWKLVYRDLEGRIVEDRQEVHETLPAFLLRLSGGLLR